MVRSLSSRGAMRLEIAEDYRPQKVSGESSPPFFPSLHSLSPGKTPGKSLWNSLSPALFTRRNGISPELLVPQIPHRSVVDRLVLQPQASQVHREGAASAASSPSPSMVCLVALLRSGSFLDRTHTINHTMARSSCTRFSRRRCCVAFRSESPSKF